MITLEEAKAYLRVDSDYEDVLIQTLLLSAESLTMDVARMTPDEWSEFSDYYENNRKTLTIRGEEKTKAEILRIRSELRVGVLFTLGYLYEHREEADHRDLVLTLRSILFAVREGVI